MHYNDVTGEALVTKPASDKYRNGWDAIFSKKKDDEVKVEPATPEEIKAQALQELVDQAQDLKLGY